MSRDEDDGMWQFHSGDMIKTEDGMIVSLKELFEIDNSIGQLARMPLGYVAERKNKQNDWTIRRNI